MYDTYLADGERVGSLWLVEDRKEEVDSRLLRVLLQFKDLHKFDEKHSSDLLAGEQEDRTLLLVIDDGAERRVDSLGRGLGGQLSIKLRVDDNLGEVLSEAGNVGKLLKVEDFVSNYDFHDQFWLFI